MTHQFGSAVVGKQLIGCPGSEILSCVPTPDYLIHGPIGGGWYDAAEDRYVTTDFIVTVRLDDGREIELPKCYRWVSGDPMVANVCDRPDAPQR